MQTTQTRIDFMQKNIIKERPMVRHLATEKSLIEFLRPALTWRMQGNIFPRAELLRSLIVSEIERLYGNYFAKKASKQLEEGWVIETGAHLHVPRKYDKAFTTEGPQINALLFQGQVLWAFANQKLGRKLSISLNSGRVPLDNTNSGAYLDLPAFKTLVTLASKKRHPDSPQTLIPATNEEEIHKKKEQMDMLKRQRLLPQNQYEVAMMVLDNFLAVQSSFSDQVATTHALMMDKILPIKQITLDSEIVGIYFLADLLEDTNSLIHKIFADSALREKFIASLADIRTGWPVGGSPFYRVSQKDEGFRLSRYEDSFDPFVLAEGLRQNTIFPTGVVKFFSMMVEAGICPSGGWTQAGYCTQIKEKATMFLDEIGYTERARVLRDMPTYIPVMSACWGLQKYQGKIELIDAISVLLNPLQFDLADKINISANQAFLVATPTLYEFILGKPPRLTYSDLKDELKFALFKPEEMIPHISFPYALRYT